MTMSCRNAVKQVKGAAAIACMILNLVQPLRHGAAWDDCCNTAERPPTQGVATEMVIDLPTVGRNNAGREGRPTPQTTRREAAIHAGTLGARPPANGQH